MPTLLCTRRFRVAFGMPERLVPSATDEGALGPWYANTLNVGPERFLHYMSAPSLLSIIIPRREAKTHIARFKETLGGRLRILEINERWIAAELSTFDDVTYARASARSGLAFLRVQNEYAQAYLGEGNSLDRVHEMLAYTPYGHPDCVFPERLAPELIRARWSEK